MSKCAMGDCNRKPVGGVEEILDVSDHTDPRVTMPGRKTAWCAEHEQALKSNFPYRRWQTLSKRELELAREAGVRRWARLLCLLSTMRLSSPRH